MSGDILVACVRCGAVYTIDGIASLYSEIEAVRAAGVDGGINAGTCRACDKSNAYRVLVGPLHVPRPVPPPATSEPAGPGAGGNSGL